MTPRRRAVMHGLLRGQTNRAIGEHLGITERAVKYHAYSIYRIYGAASDREFLARFFDSAAKALLENTGDVPDDVRTALDLLADKAGR